MERQPKNEQNNPMLHCDNCGHIGNDYRFISIAHCNGCESPLDTTLIDPIYEKYTDIYDKLEKYREVMYELLKFGYTHNVCSNPNCAFCNNLKQAVEAGRILYFS